MSSRVKIFFDGGYRPDPVGMETAVVVRGQAYLQRDLGPGTSMDAEWLALIHARRLALELGLNEVLFLGDNAGVVAQANGAVKCRGAAVRHLEAFHAVASMERPPSIRHVKRSQNLAGIALARLRVR